MKNCLISIFFSLYFLLNGQVLCAQEIEPRNYAVVPKNMNVIGLSGSISHGDVVADVTTLVKGLTITSTAVSLVYVHTFSVFQKLSRVQVTMPFVFINAGATIYGMDTVGPRAGFADARIRIGMNLIGSPVMAAKDFQKFREETVLGLSLVFSVPIGQYGPENLVNIGTNRWGVKPELGFSKRQGSWYLEMYAGVWFFTENQEYLKDLTMVSNPLLSFQGHISYNFKNKSWVGINGGYSVGGTTNLEGMDRDDGQSNFRLGATYSKPIDKRNSLKFLFNTGIAVRAGQNYTAFTIIYQYSWF